MEIEQKKHGLAMQPESTKHGFIVEPIVESDYLFGGHTKLKGQELLPSGDWTPFLPTAEHQAPIFETNGCTHFGTWNALETNYKFLFGKELNMSDRLTLAGAKQSGLLDPLRGGTPKAAIDYIRKRWSVREDEYPTLTATSVDDFYSPPPEVLLQLADSRRVEVGHIIGYEYIYNPTIEKIGEALKSGPVCFSNALMPTGDGKYYRPIGFRDGHWAQAVKVEEGLLYMRDQYPPFDKIIRGDFVPEVAIKYEMNKELAWSFKRLIEAIAEYLKKNISQPSELFPPPVQKDKTAELYEAAFSAIGTDPSKNGQAPQDRACAESLSYVIRKVFPNFPVFLSTIKLNEYLARSPDFVSSANPVPGCVSIFPTKGSTIGHCGVWGRKSWVMSNNSFGEDRGLWRANYTDLGWKEEAKKRGLPIYYYIPL